MTISALLIQPDGTTETRVVEPDFRALQEAVGGYLEGVTSGYGADWMAYADEEGRLKGLPVNETATRLARAEGWPGDFLVGPVLFVGSAYVGGEDGYAEADVPDRMIQAVVHQK